MSIDGSRLETVAGGLRNAYDFAINSAGDLFVQDSDMEADQGLPWHRPTQLYHVLPGSDLGWRSGWAKWPRYYADSIPPIAETGAGSPTGAVFYEHVMFPIRYHGALFLADWTNGRILSVKLQAAGGSYRATPSVFFEAAGLTITDLCVGPDGALYFCTGGRGTEGGVYRIAWNGDIPESFTKFTDDISRLVRFPQLDSAWAYQQRALLKTQMGARWDQTLLGVVNEKGNRAIYRRVALRTMLFYGPAPTPDLLSRLALDGDAELRRAALEMLAAVEHPRAAEILARGVNDTDARVQRAACESMTRMGLVCDPAILMPLLHSADWSVVTAARRQLENIPTAQWRDLMISTANQKAFSQMAIALLHVEPTVENASAVIQRYSQFTAGAISDDNFLRLLRTVQLALAIPGADQLELAEFKETIAREFPSRDGKINSEIAKILAFVEQSDLQGRIKAYLNEAADPAVDKLSVAMSLQTMGHKLAPADRLAILGYLEQSKGLKAAGGSYPYYLAQAVRDLAQHATPAEVDTILANGARWQNAALAVFYQQSDFNADQVNKIMRMDETLANRQDEASIRLKLASIAVLAQLGTADAASSNASGEDLESSIPWKSMDYLRLIWRRDKHRMSDVVIGLCRQPDAENWPYLVSSIGQVDDDATLEILRALGDVQRRPEPAEYYRAVLMAGYRLRDEGADAACELLATWTEEQVEPGLMRPASTGRAEPWRTRLEAWRQLLEQKFPELAPLEPPAETQAGNWTASELLDLIGNDKNVGDAQRGRMVFAANCSSCHRFHGTGETMGPELTNMTRRFSQREIVESIIQPSRVISDQYRAHEVLTMEGERHLGIISRTPKGDLILLKDDGSKIEIASEDIDEVLEAKVSAMPAGLLDSLTPKDILDLFAFIYSESEGEAHAHQTLLK